MPRKKLSPAKPEIESQQELQSTVASLAEMILAERDLKNAMDSELQAVRLKYDTDLADLAQDIERQTELCAEYCQRNPDLFPKDRKSLDLVHAVIGFRTGTPKLKLLKGFKWEHVLAKLKALGWRDAIRVKEEIDKDHLIGNRAVYDLKTAGLAVAQDETFYIEPKLEQHAAGVKVEAA